MRLRPVPGYKSTVYAEIFLGPRGQVFVKVTRGVGKGGKDNDLAVAGVDGHLAFLLNDLAQGAQLGIPRGA